MSTCDSPYGEPFGPRGLRQPTAEVWARVSTIDDGRVLHEQLDADDFNPPACLSLASDEDDLCVVGLLDEVGGADDALDAVVEIGLVQVHHVG